MKEYFEGLIEAAKSRPSVFIFGVAVGLLFGSLVF
jgi:hypothetical protein